MNTSKLHVVSRSLLNELNRCGTVQNLTHISNALQNLSRQPNQPNHQQQLASALEKLQKNLSSSEVANYSPAWRDAMEELSVADFFGSKLLKSVTECIRENQLTPNVASEKIGKLLARVNEVHKNLASLTESFEYFGIGEDALGKEACELGVIVPRRYVKNNLREFGQELIDLEKTLLVFSELVTGSREPLGIRNISSSELSVFLNYIPEVGACVALAIERIVALYKSLLEIKKLRRELEEKHNVPSDNLTGIDSHAEQVMAPGIDNLAEELVGLYGNDIASERKNELKVELRRSLRKLADKMDRGFNIELRVDYEYYEDEPSDDSGSEVIRKIVESAKNINFLDNSGDPLLFLSEPEEDTETES